MRNPAPVRQLPANTKGKDYVIGDLHGCFNLLERLLAQVNFDISCDRLFSVGDLIDRGPDSFRCLQLLAEPWFYPVLGNHEIMMLNFFMPYLKQGRLENLYHNAEIIFLMNGGLWVEDYYQSDKQCMSAEFNQYLKLLFNVPLIWVVGENQSRFHVIHAELVRPDYRKTEQMVWLDSDIDRWLDGEEMSAIVQDRLYWGRTLMGEAEIRDRPLLQNGLSTTFCGHTYDTQPRQVLSHLCIDTGAFISMETYTKAATKYGLTLFDVQKAQWLRVCYARSGVITGTAVQGKV